MSTEEVICYFCEQKGHLGRHCPQQTSNIDFSELTEEKIQKYDFSQDGSLKVSDVAPNTLVYSMEQEKEIKLFDLVKKGDEDIFT